MAQKQKAPKKLTTLPITKTKIDNILDSYIDKLLNPDNMYGMQCMDVAVQYCLDLTDGKFRMWGNARDAIKNTLPTGWKLYKNTPEFMPKRGDIAVFTLGRFDNDYGHIALVYDLISLQSCRMLEQNWDGNANTPCKLRTDYYEGVSHFIRPPQ